MNIIAAVMAAVVRAFQLLNAVLLLTTPLTAADTKPHIVFGLVDDWGWANVGYHRDTPTKEVVTPNIDSLVKEGLELDQHYAYKFCSPSRSSLLSGRLPIHVNDQNVPIFKYNPQDQVSGYGGIPPNMTDISTKLSGAGYVGHHVGKWHAGAARMEQMPTGRGFQTYFGYLDGFNDYYTEIFPLAKCNGTSIVDLWDTDKPAHGMNGTDYEEALFKKRVLSIINEHNSSTPLFLYYAPHLVHAPLEVPDSYLSKFSFIDDHERQYYHAMVNYLDDVVGEMVSALKDKEMWDNLLFFVVADNGGPVNGGANNYPLKGGKYSDWQGGVRVNAMVSGGFLPTQMRGKKTDGYIHLADWYATFCALAGVDPTDETAAKAKLPPIDSLNMWPLISGQNSTSPRVDIPLSFKSLISGPYKILTGTVVQAGWTGPQFPNSTHPNGGISAKEECGNSGCLYNIIDDPLEHINLATKETEILGTLQKKLAKYQTSYFNPDRGKESSLACDAALNKYGGFWGPYLPY